MCEVSCLERCVIHGLLYCMCLAVFFPSLSTLLQGHVIRSTWFNNNFNYKRLCLSENAILFAPPPPCSETESVCFPFVCFFVVFFSGKRECAHVNGVVCLAWIFSSCLEREGALCNFHVTPPPLSLSVQRCLATDMNLPKLTNLFYGVT